MHSSLIGLYIGTSHTYTNTHTNTQYKWINECTEPKYTLLRLLGKEERGRSCTLY